MKVTYKGLNDLASKGINFAPGQTYEVTVEVLEYLKKTFGDAFEPQEAPKVEPKIKSKE